MGSRSESIIPARRKQSNRMRPIDCRWMKAVERPANPGAGTTSA